MADKSSIEWTEATWNPTRGCSLVSAGCTNCYAMRQAHRFKGKYGAYAGLTRMTTNGPVWTGEIRLEEEMLDKPLKWKKPRRIFVNSMSDLFHESLPFESIAAVFGVMAAAPQHTFQVLTKRAERMHNFFEWAARKDPIGGGINVAVVDMFGVPQLNEYLTRNDRVSEMEGEGEYDYLITDPPEWPLRNVWLVVSVEDQPTANERIPWLLKTPAAVRGVSYEPALGPVDFEATPAGDIFSPCEGCGDTGNDGMGAVDGCELCDGLGRLNWIVVGGESGPSARPMHPDWARSVRDQCNAAGVKFFFKQWGAWKPWEPGDGIKVLHISARDGATGTSPGYVDTDFSIRSDTRPMANVGKKEAGRLLDGREWNEYPEP